MAESPKVIVFNNVNRQLVISTIWSHVFSVLHHLTILLSAAIHPIVFIKTAIKVHRPTLTMMRNFHISLLLPSYSICFNNNNRHAVVHKEGHLFNIMISRNLPAYVVRSLFNIEVRRRNFLEGTLLRQIEALDIPNRVVPLVYIIQIK